MSRDEFSSCFKLLVYFLFLGKWHSHTPSTSLRQLNSVFGLPLCGIWPFAVWHQSDYNPLWLENWPVFSRFVSFLGDCNLFNLPCGRFYAANTTSHDSAHEGNKNSSINIGEARITPYFACSRWNSFNPPQIKQIMAICGAASYPPFGLIAFRDGLEPVLDIYHFVGNWSQANDVRMFHTERAKLSTNYLLSDGNLCKSSRSKATHFSLARIFRMLTSQTSSTLAEQAVHH